MLLPPCYHPPSHPVPGGPQTLSDRGLPRESCDPRLRRTETDIAFVHWIHLTYDKPRCIFSLVARPPN